MPRHSFRIAALSWKWVATPAGCCSCGCDTESTEIERGQRLPPLLLSISRAASLPSHPNLPLNPWGNVAAPLSHMYTSTHSHTHSWGWFNVGVKVREQMGLYVVTFVWTTGASLVLCWLHHCYLWSVNSLALQLFTRMVDFFPSPQTFPCREKVFHINKGPVCNDFKNTLYLFCKQSLTN